MTTREIPGRARGIAVRLIIAMALVVLAGGLTALLVAALAGPVFFHHHLIEVENSPGTTFEHAEAAFISASTLTLAVALGASALTSLAASLILARRIGATLGTMSTAAAQVAAGRFEARVARPQVGAEFDELADAFNDMATRLDHDELLRRRLMADVAHELRTPVATISATVDALEDGVQELSPQTIEVLRTQASRLTRLAADLAAVTRAETGALRLDRQPMVPQELLEVAAESARERYAAARVGLVVETSAQLPEVWVDTDRFGQVLANLLDNALRHTPAGGQVTLGASRHRNDVRLVVADTGEGIDPVHLPHVFERFYRVDTARDRDHGGSGIGLSITRALVHAHGGTITAHSAGTGTGTQFVIDLPTTTAPTDVGDRYAADLQ
ncbi:HAMP domain-containing sensor histidine kinase [Rarobacter faecitabidus]|uniref:histidine kinase n=1 Tax=Rarobacter faecitabidus TaxID=13243 RepID=A0A542ZUI1_RARFA|nr:ATP-binding protein [Rarobacter faecitabidus]TQL63959.1 HAMP domain-containing protein [Rarobacter faecitabidus]